MYLLLRWGFGANLFIPKLLFLFMPRDINQFLFFFQSDKSINMKKDPPALQRAFFFFNLFSSHEKYSLEEWQWHISVNVCPARKVLYTHRCAHTAVSRFGVNTPSRDGPNNDLFTGRHPRNLLPGGAAWTAPRFRDSHQWPPGEFRSYLSMFG